MAVVLVEPIWDGRDGEFTDSWDRRYTQKFTVETDDPADDAAVVGFAEGIPRMWSFYVSLSGATVDPLALCRRILPVQDSSNSLLWTVTCEFDTRTTEPGTGGGGAPGQPGGGGAGDNPESRPWQIEIDDESRTEPFRYELLDPTSATPKIGSPCVNRAGDPFEPLPERQTGDAQLRVTRTEAGNARTFKVLNDLKYSLNQKWFLGYPPQTVQLLPIRGNLIFIGGLPYWERTYRFRFFNEETYDYYDTGSGDPVPRRRTWQPLLLNAGFRELRLLGLGGPTDLTYTRVDIIDPINHQRVPAPVHLTRNGFEMSREDVIAGRSVWLEFKGYKVRDWTSLNIEGPLVAANIGFEAYHPEDE